MDSHGGRCGASQGPSYEQIGYSLLLTIWCTQEQANIFLPGPHSHLYGGPLLCSKSPAPKIMG